MGCGRSSMYDQMDREENEDIYYEKYISLHKEFAILKQKYKDLKNKYKKLKLDANIKVDAKKSKKRKVRAFARP
jgi:superfamily II helicase